MAKINFTELNQHAASIDKQQVEAMASRIYRDVEAIGEGDTYRVKQVWAALSACLAVLEGDRWML